MTFDSLYVDAIQLVDIWPCVIQRGVNSYILPCWSCLYLWHTIMLQYSACTYFIFVDLVSAYSIVNKTSQQLNNDLWQWFLVGVDNEHWKNLDVELLAVRGKAVIGECWKSSHKSENQAVQTTYQHPRFSECIQPRMCCNSKVPGLGGSTLC